MTDNEHDSSISDLFLIKQSGSAGRAAIARKAIPQGTLVLQDSSTVAHVIFRPYRREVCAYCFAYDRGREWKLRISAAGVTFCSTTCQDQWKRDTGNVGLEAHVAVENFLRQQQKRLGGNGDDYDHDSDVDMGGLGPHDGSNRLSLEHDEIDRAWDRAEKNTKLISRARSSSSVSKESKRLLRQAMELSVDADLPYYLLSGILKEYELAAVDKADVVIPKANYVPSLSALAEDISIFTSEPSLVQYARGYTLLMAILPLQLLPYVQPTLCRDIASRASHNAFTIRPPSESDGEQSGEFLGLGIWPRAAIFNHSCAPNVRKERRGRAWHFFIDSQSSGNGVGSGEELCITYLGGDENDLNVSERRRKLKEEWDFFCCCIRCVRESSASTQVGPSQ